MTRSLAAILLLLGSIPPIARAAQAPRAEELLERSIRYHDPEGLWMNTAHRLVLEETRPNGPARRTILVIDNRAGRFEMTRETAGAPTIEIRVVGEEVEARLDGSPEFSVNDAEKYRLTPEAAKRTRNYYTFLYGLPMKLRDPGTRLDPEARRTKFQGKDVLALRVTYDETVGGDIWYFYLDPDSCALVGYRFYHDEDANDGEYITLEEEARAGTIRLPRVRTWYTNDGAKLLGTDAIETIEAATSSEFVDLSTGYIEAWKRFYPSRAYSLGFLPSIHGIENYSAEAIRAWVDLNQQTLGKINESSGQLTRDEAIDARLVAAKIRSELEKWERDRPHETSLALFQLQLQKIHRHPRAFSRSLPPEQGPSRESPPGEDSLSLRSLLGRMGDARRTSRSRYRLRRGRQADPSCTTPEAAGERQSRLHERSSTLQRMGSRAGPPSLYRGLAPGPAIRQESLGSVDAFTHADDQLHAGEPDVHQGLRSRKEAPRQGLPHPLFHGYDPDCRPHPDR